ncbi:MAG TPA: L,D-transpeptidase [Thermoleophilaceae bacterium]|jgi:lipoprotein-anchoring transpeptidase ErfK/SrfK
MTTRLLPIPLVLLALAPAAQAQTVPPPTPPPVTPPAPPAAGRATLTVQGGQVTRKQGHFYAPAQQVVVRGFVKPAVQGEVLTMYAIRRGKASKQVRRRVGRGGRYLFRFKVGNAGPVRIVVKHSASARQAAFRTRDVTIHVVNWQAGAGERGLKVLLLQRGLLQLGFATPVTGYYDGLTANAVNAFRKTNEMGRDGYATTSVYGKVLRGNGAYKLRYPSSGTHGKHVEFDWSRQVLVLADRGRPYRVYHVSSGKPSTPTVFGSFRFYRKQPGTNSHGMVYSSYFIGGYAIHGYASVPNFAASHGCLRVPIPNAVSIYNWIDLGDPIFTYL